jgi:hypothetical protein
LVTLSTTFSGAGSVLALAATATPVTPNREANIFFKADLLAVFIFSKFLIKIIDLFS